MGKRILITGVILLFGISIIIGIFLVQSKTMDSVNPIRVIPQDAAVILHLNKMSLPESLLHNKSKVWQELNQLGFVKKLNSEIYEIDSLINSVPELVDVVSENDIYISGHITGAKQFYYLTLVPLPTGFREKQILSIIKNPVNRLKLQHTIRKYEGKSIIEINSITGNKIYLSVDNGLIICSRTSILIENAIRQATLNKSLLNNKGFTKVLNAAGKNKDANIFIDLKQAGKLFAFISNTANISQHRNFKSLGDWTELDVNLKEDLMLLNGFSYCNDSSRNFINTISALDPVNISVDKILPSGVSGFISYGISSPADFYINYLNYLKGIGIYHNYNANLKKLNDKYKLNFEDIFLDLLDDEITLAYKSHSPNQLGNHYLIIKCRSGKSAKEALGKMADKIGRVKSGNLKFTYSPDNDVNYPVYKISITPLFGWIFGRFFDVFDEQYVTVIDNYIVVANSYKDATSFIYDNLLHKTLKNDPIYQDFSKSLSAKSYMLCYLNLAKIHPYFKNILKRDLLENWEGNIQAFYKVQTMGIQLSEVSSMPYLNMFVKHHDDYFGRPKTIWESLLDTTISFKPVFVKNHYSGEKEIVVQDDQDKLYLLSKAGRIIWKIPLKERINSEVFQIDYYKNRKLQLLFSTKNYLHCIDREGNYVEKYPVRLRESSSAGMSLFDYEKNKNYRIFIPCTDKKVYAYSKEGKILSGWTFRGSDHIVRRPVNYFRVGQKDYIVCGDGSRNYILNRRGEDRVRITKDFPKSIKNQFYLNNTNVPENSYLVTTDTTGAVMKIYFSGKVIEQKLNKFSGQHFFDFKDVDADGKDDYIFLDKNKLWVYHSTGELIFDYEFKHLVDQRPVYYHFSSKERKIGVVSGKDKKIYLINDSGMLYKGFPLTGTTMFSIGYFDITSSRFNLVVGGENNFLYNYAVE